MGYLIMIENYISFCSRNYTGSRFKGSRLRASFQQPDLLLLKNGECWLSPKCIYFKIRGTCFALSLTISSILSKNGSLSSSHPCASLRCCSFPFTGIKRAIGFPLLVFTFSFPPVFPLTHGIEICKVVSRLSTLLSGESHAVDRV